MVIRARLICTHDARGCGQARHGQLLRPVGARWQNNSDRSSSVSVSMRRVGTDCVRHMLRSATDACGGVKQKSSTRVSVVSIGIHCFFERQRSWVQMYISAFSWMMS